jgi:nucleoid-associated protein YgaU
VKAPSEYHFARIEGVWQLLSFTRIPSEMEVPPRASKPRTAASVATSASAVRPPEPSKAESERPATATPAAPRPAPTTASAVAPRSLLPRHYVIQQGDTLSAISQQFYGTTRYWRRILEANPGLRERRLRVGRKILIPSPPAPIPPSREAGLKPTTATP